jgi:Arc/MetJ family transcription regulator
MPTEKVSLTLEEDLVAAARDAAGKRGFSSYVNLALRRQLQRDRAIELLDELEAEHGPIAADVMEEVRAEWPDANADVPKRRRSA